MLLKSAFSSFPEGFEYFGPHIRIPREQLYSRLETSGNPQVGQRVTKLSFDKKG